MKNNSKLESNQSERITFNRRYDLDWLRVIAFGVLILYHIGMYYVDDWGWHIKSDVTSVLLQDFMILTNPWRMTLLFFISGIALASIFERKYGALKLIELRTRRLFVPLIFGMFVIVSPQVYIEFLDNKLIAPGFINFWLEYVNPYTELLTERHSVIGLLTWNHLWFLPYLWVYSILMLIIAKPVATLGQSRMLRSVPLIAFVVCLMAILIITWLSLREEFPTTHDLINDWYNHGKYFLAFIAGYLLFYQKHWWQQMIVHRNWLLLIALLTYAFIIGDRHGAFPEMANAYQQNIWIKMTYGIIFSANIWCWILAVVGLTGHFLNKDSKLLRYANHAILPWYILHQTLIVVFAWWLKRFAIAPQLEFFLLLLLTVLSCLIIYELINRSKFLSWLSGVKPQ